MSIVIKGNGEREEFHIEKLALSMKNVGADPALAEHVARAIGAEVKEGMTTTEIYRRAYALLRKEE
ncbi:MAG TPA: ATPase, partial [Candidatus Paceibacterota bacterium]